MKKEFYKYMKENVVSDNGFFRLHKEIKCKDGFKMSVQASEGHYCSPRQTLPIESYSSFEIGYPSKKEDLIMEYAEDNDYPTKTVYGWCPLDVVLEVLKKHDGIKAI